MEEIKKFYKEQPFWFWTTVVVGCISPRAFVVLCIAVVVHRVLED